MNDVRGGGYFCTKKLYKSCTTVSRGGTIPLSMRFLSIRRSSIPVCGIGKELQISDLDIWSFFLFGYVIDYDYRKPKEETG